MRRSAIRRSRMIDTPSAGPDEDSTATDLPDTPAAATDSYDPNLDRIGKP